MAKKTSGVKRTTTSDVATAVAAETGQSKAAVRKVIRSLGTTVAALVSRGHRVSITGLGIYYLRHVKATKAGTRNAFGTQIRVKAKPARKVPKVRLPKAFKDLATP